MTEVGRNPAVLYLFGKLLKSTFCGGDLVVMYITSCSVIFLCKATKQYCCCLFFVSKPANNFCFFKGNLSDEESNLSVVGHHIMMEIPACIHF